MQVYFLFSFRRVEDDWRDEEGPGRNQMQIYEQEFTNVYISCFFNWKWSRKTHQISEWENRLEKGEKKITIWNNRKWKNFFKLFVYLRVWAGQTGSSRGGTLKQTWLVCRMVGWTSRRLNQLTEAGGRTATAWTATAPEMRMVSTRFRSTRCLYSNTCAPFTATLTTNKKTSPLVFIFRLNKQKESSHLF